MIKIIGWTGTAVLIGVYALNSFGYISSASILYPALNLLAAILLGIRVYADKNYSNVILEIFWAGIAIAALINFFI